MSALLGPTDAGNFRVKVGRYGDRWYTDPLPGCELAPATEWTGPSVSTTKPPFGNKYVPMRAIADMADAEWTRLAAVDPDTRYEAIKAHDKRTSRLNMDRGTIVHRYAEDKLLGRTPLPLPESWAPGAREAAETFYPAIDAFFDTYQPRLVACEVVCLHRSLNGVGYGGTADAFVDIEGDVWAVDWKSRLSDHGAYLEEAAQGGAYVGAEYMIVAGPDGAAVRAPMPEVAGVLIVSIRPDGFRAYPIDRDGAVTAYAEMHRWWTAQRRVTDKKVIGKPWGPRMANKETSCDTNDAASTTSPQPSTTPHVSTDDRTTIVDRVRNLVDAGHAERLSIAWPEGVPGFKTDHQHTADELARVLDAVRAVEDHVSAPFHPDDAEVVGDPDGYKKARGAVHGTRDSAELIREARGEGGLDDGPVVDDATKDALNEAFAALEPEQAAWVKTIHAAVNGHTTPTGNPHVRQWSILRAAVAWAPVFDDEMFRDLAGAVTGDEACRQPGVDIGALFAALTTAQADDLADMAHQIAHGTAVVEHPHDRWTIRRAA